MIETLLAKIESGECSANDLNVARAMLKDNGITGDPTNPEQGTTDLAKALAALDLELPN